MNQKVLEDAIGYKLKIPSKLTKARPTCNCLLGNDIGAYNSCAHSCRYCYANYDLKHVAANRMNRDPNSPLLIGQVTAQDTIKQAIQVSFRDPQLSLF